MKKYYKLIYTLPAILIATTIFILSNQSRLPIDLSSFANEDKLAHLIAYFAFGVSLIIFITGNFPTLKKSKVILWTIVVGAIFGISDEFHQSFIPNRTADVYDWLTDCAGILLSLLFIKQLKQLLYRFFYRTNSK